jgi:FdhD protein
MTVASVGPGRDLRPGSTTRARVLRVDGQTAKQHSDLLATEEPLEIRVDGRSLTVTMRTPGADFELAVGFLHGEGIVRTAEDVASVRYCVDASEQQYNVVSVGLAPGVPPPDEELMRNVLTTSACGVCGTASLQALRERGVAHLAPGPVVSADVLRSLSKRLAASQPVFDRTGGLHAAALFTPAGDLLAVREDIGRHNAVDKVLGWALLQHRLPLAETLLLVSGRAGYEIAQKAVAAGVPIVAAVSAPSSLAVSLAREFGLTLVGFLRGTRFSVYSAEERVSVGD